MTLADAQLKMFVQRALVDAFNKLEAGGQIPYERLSVGETARFLFTVTAREKDTDDAAHVLVFVAVSESPDAIAALRSTLEADPSSSNEGSSR